MPAVQTNANCRQPFDIKINIKLIGNLLHSRVKVFMLTGVNIPHLHLNIREKQVWTYLNIGKQ